MVRFWRMAVVLGLITAVGPFAIDMYLPQLPTIGASLHASPSAVQMSMTAFFITVGVCQLFYGPLSDMIGRKPPIYLGLVVFFIGSIGCAFSPSISVLIFFRVVQALGSCAGMVVPRAIVRDLHTGPDAARLMSLLMLTVSISPILAPLSGSLVSAAVGWRGIFGVLAGASAIAFLIAAVQLPETYPASERTGSSWMGSLRSYGTLARDPGFLGLVFAGACGISAFFVFIGSASFVYIDHYGLTQTQFSLMFAVNAISFFGCSQMTGALAARYGLVTVVRVGVTGFALAMTTVAVIFASGIDSMPLLAAFLFIGYGFLGLVLPSTAVLALELHGAIAGTASALMGALQMITGAAFMGVSGLFANDGPKPMILGIAFCAICSFIIAQASLRPGSKLVTAVAT